MSGTATWRSGYAAACKAVYTGSIPVVASRDDACLLALGADTRRSWSGVHVVELLPLREVDRPARAGRRPSWGVVSRYDGVPCRARASCLFRYPMSAAMTI
jgi:hypothetical protein